MAVVLDGFTAAFTRVPFLKPPDMQRMVTAMPRALVYFVVNDGDVSAKPVNDQQAVQVLVNFPIAFAYRMIGCEMSIVQDEASAFGSGAEYQITNAMRGQELGVTTRHVMSGVAFNTFATITPGKQWIMSRPQSFILQSISAGVSCFIDFRVVNTTATAAAAGTIKFLGRFYEYDIEQVQMFPALLPTLVYQTN